MSKHIRFTALLLAVSLLCNTTLPAIAEGSVDTVTVTEETTAPTEAAVPPSEEPTASAEAPVTEETTVPEPTVQETIAPAEETTAPIEETAAPAEETTAPAEDTTAPTEEAVIVTGTVVCSTSVNIRSGPGTSFAIVDVVSNGHPVRIYEIVRLADGDWGRIGQDRWIYLTYVQLDSAAPTEPTEESIAPTEESSEPTEEVSEPTEESTEPTKEVSVPTEESTEPTEEVSVPTEDASEPTEESSEPTEDADLSSQIDAILSAEVIPGRMSLTWWALRCGKLDTEALLTAETGEDIQPPVLDYVPENNTLYITSSQDLRLLSYVEASAYCNLTLDCSATAEEHRGFDLLDQPESLSFRGLGSPDCPFSGTLHFAEGTGPILLEAPLFIALSDDAELIHLVLESRAEEALEGGLLAKLVTHQRGGNTWSITLEQPVLKDSTPVYLSPLLGSLAGQSDVALELTDRSGLRVLGSGYLCGVMEAGAQLLVSGISSVPAVTGYGENVGGLVGLMKPEASLIVFGETLRLSGVTGPQQVGGAVGSACDPILSLPTIVGEDCACLRGENVGGLAGSLTLSAGEHAITQNAANLTLEGSANAGGLFGILCQEDATLTLSAQVDNVNFGESHQGNCGTIFGSFQSPSLDNVLILNGAPVVGRSGFEQLAGSIQAPAVTVEEAQKLLDEIASAELVPGQMSLTWWAVINGKITAEEYAAELNGTAKEPEPTKETSSSEETEPVEEMLPESTQASQPVEETEPTGQTEATEEATLPSDDTPGEEPDAAQEDVLLPEDVLLADFSLDQAQSPVFFSLNEEGEDTAVPSTEEAEADSPSLLEAADTPDPSLDWPEGVQQFSITDRKDLITLSYVDPSVYDDGTIKFNITGSLDLTTACIIDLPDGSTAKLSFWGLGNSAFPFSGSVELDVDSVNTYIKLSHSLFNNLSDKAIIESLNLAYKPPTEALAISPVALLAEYITHDNSVTESNPWSINLKNVQTWGSLPLIGTMGTGSRVMVNLSLCVGTQVDNDIDNSFESVDNCALLNIQGGGYLCNLMKETASLTVNLLPGSALDLGSSPTAVGIPKVTASGNAGGLVGEMGPGAVLSVSADGSLPISDVTSETGNAGGLVGCTGDGASVTLTLTGDGAALSISKVTAEQNAGGLIGQATNLPFTDLPNITGSNVTITSTGASAGGLIGLLTVNNDKEFSQNSSIPNLTVNGYDGSGGLFGSLQNNDCAFTICDSTTKVSFNSTTGNAGGLIGSYAASKLEDTLILSGNDTTSTLANALSSYGGLIGYIGNAAYVQVSSGTVATNQAQAATPTSFGGLIGDMSDSGSFLWVGTPPTSGTNPESGTDVILNLDKIAGSIARGGVVGNMPSGVIALSVYPTITAGSVVSSTDNDNQGWILGSRGNTLVYTTTSWPERADDKKMNDTGVWGQVLRVGGTLSGLLDFDNTTHTVTVAGVTGTTDITVSNEADLAALALRLQLNESASMKFTGGDTTTSNGITISLSKDINLSNTGLTCLMQDRYDTTDYSITIHGNSHIITLPSVKVYVSETHKTHNRQGLISRAKTLTAENLTIGGTGYSIHVLTANGGVTQELNVGMLAAEVVGTSDKTAEHVKLKNVTSSADIIVSSEKATKAKVGGLIGVIDINVINTILDGCVWDGSITDSCNSSTYLGGFISIYSNQYSSNTINITSTGCKISGSITKTNPPTGGSSYVPIGGFICTLYYGTTNLNITNLTAESMTITVQGGSANPAKCGGILSYDWININATVVGLTVKNCTLTYPTSTTHFGALVYKASGICTLGDGSNPGITFESGNKITGYSPTSTPSGLFIAYGSEGGKGVYLQVLQNGYVINQNAVELDLTYGNNNKKYFDELVGITWVSDTAGMGIVSIATATTERQIDTNGTRNTYKNKLTDKPGNVYTNPYTRYYYDLDYFRSPSTINGDSTISGNVNTPQRMVLLSAWGNCTSNLRKYFYKGTPGKITNPAGGTLDLTGYSYYPIPFSGQSIDDATIKFAHKEIVDVETNTAYHTSTDKGKSPSIQDNQHTLMHTGIFRDMKLTDTSTNMKLVVRNLTLKGNIGQRMDQNYYYSYGALFCGEVYGADVDHIATLNIDGINLDGIQVYYTSNGTSAGTLGVPAGTSNAPLLVASLGNYVTLDMKNVKTTSAYSTGTYAASSLIGTAGSDIGTNIKLTFEKMGLDGRITAGEEVWQNTGTKQTIFSHALFIDSFRYSDSPTCKGIYNFLNATPYTCGQELSNSETGPVSGRNNDEQYHFFKSLDDMVYLAVDSETEKTEKTFFATGYRRYVGNSEGQNGDLTYHELDVNLWKAPLDEGCGTYSHPYIISNGKQLMALAEALEYGKNEGWAVNLNAQVLGSTFSQQEGHIEGQESYPNDLLYTCEGDTWVVADSETTADSTDVLNYLRNAYYLIRAKEDENGNKLIKLGSKWAGLGKASGTGAFSGVIVGAGDGTIIQITANTTPVYQYGGLIKCSMGSVVKDVIIRYTGSPLLRSEVVPSIANPGTVSFFGGVVGWCMGGDTILDNVSITFNGSPSVSGAKPHLAAVGGYVGLVGGGTDMGGYGGGVVFRGISNSALPTVTVGSGTANPANDIGFLYVNPYVGRVLDGYALSENTALNNTEKNYNIPRITVEKTHLSISDDTILVNDADGLWVLSAIVNSGLNETAYTLGKPRTADYEGIGSSATPAQLVDEGCLGGVGGGSRGSSYLAKFADIPSLTGPYSLTFTGDCDVSQMGNGFRGLGGSYGTVSYNRMLPVSTVTSAEGVKTTITLGQNRKEYTDEAETWTSIGAGLFPVLDASRSLLVSNLNLAGTTGITYYDADGTAAVNPISGGNMLMDASTKPNRLGSSGAGLLAGTLKKADSGNPSITLTGLTVGGSVTGSATFAGGIIGLACVNSSGSPSIASLTVTDCIYQNLSVSGHACVGGFLGYAFADALTIQAEKTMSGLTVTSEEAEINGALTGVGGLIGRCDTAALTIGGTGDGKLVFSENLSVTNGNTTSTSDRTFTGGLAGLLGIRQNGTAAVQNIAMNAIVSISNSSVQNSSGALAGALAYYNKAPFMKETDASDQWDLDNSGSVTVQLSGIDISDTGSVTIQKTKQGGTLFGWLMAARAETGDPIRIGSEGGTISLNTTEEVENASLGGLIGVVSHANPLNLSDITLKNTQVWGLPSTTNRGAALVVGYAEKEAAIHLRKVRLQNCSVAVGRNDANAGFLYAHFDGSDLAGYQILIDGCTIGLSQEVDGSMQIDSTAQASTGLFGGKAKDKTVRLVGVSVKSCSGPVRDFADASGTKYAVRADYTGKVFEDPSAITTVPTLALPGVELSSDGIGLEDKPYAQQIIDDTAVPTCNDYFDVASEIAAFNASASVSTFLTEGENSFWESEEQALFEDFSVLVINSNEGTNADTIIRSYISILTNVPDSKLHITESDFELNCYHWENDAFTADNSRASLDWNTNSKKLTVTPGGYDNQRMQFTLMKVSYADPTGSGEAFLLYIPIIVKKVLQFRFWASAENGSSYNATHYTDLQQSAIGSNKDLITSLLTFQYLWTKAEWQTAVDSGSPLLWNFDKEILLNHNGRPLTAATRLTLVDCNDQSKAYYGTYSSNTIRFSSLYSPTEEKNWASSNTPLCDLLKLKETVWEEGDAKFVQCSPSGSPTLRIGEVYYRPAADGEENYCSIEVGLDDDELVEETYFLTFQTQDSAEDAAVYNFLIECASRLKNPEGNGLPTQLKVNKYANNENENRLVISNFFSQSIAVSTGDSAEVMSATENTLSGTLTSTVWFPSGEAYSIFNAQKKDRNLQQSFCLYLRNQDGNAVPFPEGTTVEIDGQLYSVEPGYSCWLPIKSITSWAPNNEGKQSAQVKTAFTLHFTPQGIADTFPERVKNTEGVQVFASSSLSLNPEALQRSNQRVGPALDDQKRWFYRTDASVATLTYNAYQIVGGSQGRGLSQLGVNGLEKGSFDISTAGVYDVSALKSADDARYLKCTLTLYPKNGEDYPTPVSTDRMTDYLSKARISAAVIDLNGQRFDAQVVDGTSWTVTGQSSADIRTVSVFFDLNNAGSAFDKNIPIQLPVDLTVITGSAFEAMGFTYANYRVKLTAALLDGSGEILNGSIASDYIIYTNAKILTTLVQG